MLELAFLTIDGEPVAKGRPRFRVIRKFVQTYTPAKTKKAEQHIREEIKKQFVRKPFTLPLVVELDFFFSIPKSYTKKQRQYIEDNYYYHTHKPDCDNLAKLVLDAMNGLVYEDDKQVFGLMITKRYAIDNRDVRTEIRIKRAIG
jgi:Holliday junction resolvase RusA-like endonuclease